MSVPWAQKWNLAFDAEVEALLIEWTDDDGTHSALVNPAEYRLDVCQARIVTESLQDLFCGRRADHRGSHVPIGHWRKQGLVAD